MVQKSEVKRLQGLCPFTPEEITLVLKALGFTKDTLVRKEKLLSPDELQPFQNHSTQMTALDYKVSVFTPSYDGNMARVVEGHRRYMGFRKTISLDREKLVELLDLFQRGALSWVPFSAAVKEAHQSRMGQAAERKVIPGQPKKEDYFYANPQECLGSNGGLRDVS